MAVVSEPEWAAVDEEERWAGLLVPVPSNGKETYAAVEGRFSLPPNSVEDSWQPLNLAELPDTPPVQPNLAPAGIVYPGKRHVFSGPQESAKTLAAYAIALEVLRNDPHATVVLIDFEMGAYDTRTRLRELGATDAELAHIAYVEPSEPAAADRVGRLVERNPALVIIDAAAGAYDLEGLDDNKRQDVEKFARRYIRAFWQAGIATILLDHVTKDAESRGKYAIGSERKVGGADVHIGFEVISPIRRGASGQYKLVTHKDRGGYLQRGKLADLELHSDPETHRITWEFKPAAAGDSDAPKRYTIYMERVSRTLETLNEPHTQNEITKLVTGGNDYIAAAITQLVDEGYCTSTPGPRGANLIKSARPYRQTDDPHLQLSTSPDLSASSPEERSTSPLQLSAPLTGAGEVGTSPGEHQTSPALHTDPLDDIPF